MWRRDIDRVVVYEYFNLPVAGDPDYARTSNILGALNGANVGGVSHMP
jgi:hypothetical protein